MNVIQSKLLMKINDNGNGFVIGDKEESGNGLKNMQRRAIEMNGNCEIKSNLGTTILVSIPLI